MRRVEPVLLRLGRHDAQSGVCSPGCEGERVNVVNVPVLNPGPPVLP